MSRVPMFRNIKRGSADSSKSAAKDKANQKAETPEPKINIFNIKKEPEEQKEKKPPAVNIFNPKKEIQEPADDNKDGEQSSQGKLNFMKKSSALSQVSPNNATPGQSLSPGQRKFNFQNASPLSMKFGSAFVNSVVKQEPEEIKLNAGQFKVSSKILDKTEMSLYLFSNKNKLRIFLVNVTEHIWFNRFMLFVIFLNAMSFAIVDKSMQKKNLNYWIEVAQYIFSAIYIIEAAIHIIVDGFIIGKLTYLRNPINCFDFLIVVCAICEIVLNIVNAKSAQIKTSHEPSTLESFFRLMRAMRTVNLLAGLYEIPQLRKQIRAIGKAVNGLANVGFFLLCFFSLMAIIGLQLFSDDIGNACRVTPEPVEIDGKLFWERADTTNLSPGGICSKVGGSIGGFTCPPEYTCGSYLDYGMPLSEDLLEFNGQEYYKVATWENFGTSGLTVFQLVTGDSWSNHMYNLMNGTNVLLPVFFVFTLQMLGTYFFMNLMLAVIMEKYIESEQICEQEELEARDVERKKLEEAVAKQENFSALSKLLEKKNQPQTDNGFPSSRGKDGLTKEERESLDAVKKKCGFEVKSKNKMLNMLGAKIKQQVNNAQKELDEQNNKLKGIGDSKSRQRFEDLNMKAVAARQIEDRVDRENALKLIAMEEQEALLDLNKQFAKGVNADKNSKFMLKDENKLALLIKGNMAKEFGQVDESQQIPTTKKERRESQMNKMMYALTMMKTVRADSEGVKEQGTNADLAAQDLLKLQKAFTDVDNSYKTKDLIKRAASNPVYATCYDMMNHKYFMPIISFCILANTVVLAFNKFPNSGKEETIMGFINQVFFIIFLLEAFIKLLGEGSKSYFSEFFNMFDFFIIVVSTIDLVLENVNIQKADVLAAIRVLRVFRLLRVFKLAKVWKDLNDLLVTMGLVIVKISYLLIILLFFMMTFSILGKEFFAFKMAFDVNDRPVENFFDFETGIYMEEGYWPDFNFNTFMESLNTVFIFLAVDGWSGVYYNLARMPGINKALSFIYCYSLMIGGKMILFQLFVAILLKEFDERSIITKVEENEEVVPDKKTKFSLKKFLVALKDKICCCCCEKKDDGEGEQDFGDEKKKDISPDLSSEQKDFLESPKSEQQQGNPIKQKKEKPPKKDSALCCLDKENKFRQVFIKFEVFKIRGMAVLDTLIWTAIIISSIQLAFDSPLQDKNSQLSKTMAWINYVMTCIFTVEVIVKVIAQGFLFNGKTSYMRNSGNVLDFFIVLFALVDISVTGVDLSFLKIIRMGKLVRPMRLVFRNENLQITIQALIQATPKIFNLLMLSLLIYSIFGIIGINLYAGKFFFCETGAVISLDAYHKDVIISTQFECINAGGEWVKWHTNFDSLPTSMLQMFSMAQTVGWELTMIRGMKSTGVMTAMNTYPPFNAGVYQSFFFMFWMVVGCFFLQNLFVGVVISQYNRESEKLGKNQLLTDDQKDRVESKMMTVKVKPIYRNVEPKNCFRRFCYRIVEAPMPKSHSRQEWEKSLSILVSEEMKQQQKFSEIFDNFITCVIMLNTITLTLKWPTIGETTVYTLDIINYCFTGIFILEAIIKLTALGKNYFRDGWNNFDFSIVVGSIIFLHPFFKSQKSTITVIRAFRVGRVFKSFNKLKQLRDIFQTIIRTLPGLVNVGMLILLVVYLFAIIGVTTFGDIKLNGPMHSYLNFQTLPKAYLSLYRVLTGENWNDLLEAISLPRSITNQCIEGPSYEDYVANGYEAIGCGKRYTATIYFCCYVFLISIICMNLLIAIILSGYATISDKSKNMQLNSNIEKFQEVWAEFDPDGKGIIQEQEFDSLMFRLGKPYGFPTSYNFLPVKRKTLITQLGENMQKHLNDIEHRWFFNEVLDELIYLQFLKESSGIKEESESSSDEEEEIEEIKTEQQTPMIYPTRVEPVTEIAMNTIQVKSEGKIERQESQIKVVDEFNIQLKDIESDSARLMEDQPPSSVESNSAKSISERGLFSSRSKQEH